MVSKTQLLKARAPKLPSAFFSGRRKEFFANLPEDSVAIIVSNPEMTRSNDTEYPYRQSSDILYLSGFPEPGTVLVFKKSKKRQRFIMFVRPKDLDRETWTGRRFGVEGAKSLFGCTEAHSIDDFEKVMEEVLAAGVEQIFHKFDRNSAIDEKFKKLWLGKQKPIFNVEDILHPMRHIKVEAELAQMRHACEISAQAHSEAMRRVRPGMHEFEIQGIIEGFAAACGAPEQAYNTIAGGGKNGVILHYNTNSDELADGDLLLVDAGCEFRGYASDITRTYPVNGKFSQAQKEVYEIVLAAQLAAIKAAKPGASINGVHAAADNVLRRGLVKLGILPAKMAAKAAHDKIVARAHDTETVDELAHVARFFMHGTSHWMGLDVHDVCGLDKKAGKELPLAPGMVITVEPGLYFRPDDKLVPKRYRGIGIRIEDDVLIVSDGCEVLTASVPKTVSDIERLMAEPVSEV
ncbi:MAG: aminopeptidase P N-terminal domain-containing protein [Candidatus Melainabacteria bacterium]|nr:aminopeptidase P N-terminal domain-containing protein [Candidatus Melainabacteria bacterium]